MRPAITADVGNIWFIIESLNIQQCGLSQRLRKVVAFGSEIVNVQILNGTKEQQRIIISGLKTFSTTYIKV